MSEKLCVFCKHFDWERLNYTHYSDETGGDMSGGMSCNQRHFIDENPMDNDDFRRVILTAQNCPDYAPPK